MQLDNLLEGVKSIAKRAGDIMLDAKERKIHIKGRQDFVTETDLEVNRFIIKELGKLFPEGKMFTEETDDHSLSPDGYTWIVDPIDGTSNFIFDMQLSCVSIGLVYQNKSVLGVVFNPYSNEMFYAIKGSGAFLNGKKITVNPADKVGDSIILCETNPYSDRKSLINQNAINRVYRVCVDYRVLGTVALDVCYIACGRGSGFFTESASPWDYAAATRILQEAGGRVSRWDGSEVSYMGTQCYVATNTKVHDELLGYLIER